ncbi:CP12 domain, putative [Synechococcus sp. CC9311]|nr:CP12 domain, putative [Synechococcus sp. CC9311]
MVLQKTSRKMNSSQLASRAADSMKSIDEHIKKDQSEIEAARASGDEAKVRHLTEELHSLEEYKEHNPGDKHDPTSLELYCDANPEAEECRVYDD